MRLMSRFSQWISSVLLVSVSCQPLPAWGQVEQLIDQRNLDDNMVVLRVSDVSAGQWSFPHPADTVVIPFNAGALLQNIEVDVIGQWSKRAGYAQIANDLGNSPIDGVSAYNVPGGSRLLITETSGTVYTWDGAAATHTSSQAGLTDATDWTELVVANNRLFRLGQTDTIRSFNGTTWTDEGNTNTDPPLGKLGLWTSNQRFLIANTSANPNALYPSDAGDPQTFDRTANVFRIGVNDTDGITCMAEFTANEVIAFTRSEMHALNTSNATVSNWTRAKVADVGCEAHRTLRQIGEDMLFLSRDGVRSVVQSAQDKKRGASVPLSFPVQDWIDRINWAQVDQAIAWVWNDAYFLSLPIDAATTNTHVLVWSRRAFEANGKRGGWTVFTNWASNAYATQAFSTTPRLYFGEASNNSLVYQARSATPTDDALTDAGTAITLQFDSRRDNLGLPELDKRWEVLEVEVGVEVSGTLKIDAAVNGEAFSNLGSCSLVSAAPSLPIDLPFNLAGVSTARCKLPLGSLGRGRELQLRFIETTSGISVDILGYIVAAFLESFELS